MANAAALVASFWWLVDSNFIHDSEYIEIEPIVCTLALIAALLGLNYVNDKIGRPLLRFKIQQCLTKDERGISVELQNHSIYKCHIRRFFLTMPRTKEIYQILRDDFTNNVLGRISLEPGQSFSFNIEREVIMRAGDVDEFQDLIAEDDIGRRFTASRRSVRGNLRALYQSVKPEQE